VGTHVLEEPSAIIINDEDEVAGFSKMLVTTYSTKCQKPNYSSMLHIKLLVLAIRSTYFTGGTWATRYLELCEQLPRQFNLAY
jgi:hypothetical protein